jgi:hypothetical protein
VATGITFSGHDAFDRLPLAFTLTGINQTSGFDQTFAPEVKDGNWRVTISSALLQHLSSGAYTATISGQAGLASDSFVLARGANAALPPPPPVIQFDPITGDDKLYADEAAKGVDFTGTITGLTKPVVGVNAMLSISAAAKVSEYSGTFPATVSGTGDPTVAKFTAHVIASEALQATSFSSVAASIVVNWNDGMSLSGERSFRAFDTNGPPPPRPPETQPALAFNVIEGDNTITNTEIAGKVLFSGHETKRSGGRSTQT